MAEKNTPNKKSKGFFEKMKGLVYEETETTTEEKSTTQSAGSENTTSKFSYSEVQGTPAVINMPGSNGVFDQRFYDGFLQIIEENNIEGIDYCEFSKSKRANDSIPGMTEQMKFQVAFQTLKANSPKLTKEVLLQTADFYLGKLNDEETNFNAEMQNEVNAQVNSKLSQAKSKQDEILKKQEEVAKLQSEMVALQTEIGVLNNEAQQTQGKIDATAKNFKVSLEVLKNQINQDKTNIQNFIQ